MRISYWSSDVCSSDLLDHGAAGAFGSDADQALGGHASGLLGGRGEALLAQPVDRGLEVAAALGQRLLAVHHARAGRLAQFLDERRCDLDRKSTRLNSSH